jgi:hypothetical protein
MPCPLPCPSPYVPRAASDTVLYDVVQAELAPFLAAARAAEVALPPYVEAELRAFLRCGVLACGFGRARCQACGFDRLVPFSCKRRGVCASCGGRRMNETAAVTFVQRFGSALNLNPHLHVLVADGVFLCREDGSTPSFVPTPPPTRRALAAVLQTVAARVARIQKVGADDDLGPLRSVAAARGTFTRMRDAEAADVPAAREPEGLRAGAGVEHAGFNLHAGVRVAADDRAGLERLCRYVARPAVCADDDLGPLRSVAAARGTFTRMRDAEEADGPASQEQKAEAGLRAGAGVEHAGFNLHAGVRVAADDRAGLERLCRYVARPAVCAARVALREDGAVTYRLKTPRRSGETHRVMQPEEFLARLVALIPPPRFPLVRYHGVFAPNAPWRGAIVPGPRRVHHRDRGRPRASVARCVAAASEGGVSTGVCLTRWDWATLLRHVWGVDALACPRCEGRMRFIAVIRDRDVIERILRHLKLPHEQPRAARARDPC